MASPTGQVCANCDAELSGPFCHRCGQADRPMRISFWTLLAGFLREAFEADGRLARTIKPLFIKPGFLVREYLNGHRVRYTSPLKIYVFAALASFFVIRLTTPGPTVTTDGRNTSIGFAAGETEERGAAADAPSSTPETEEGNDDGDGLLARVEAKIDELAALPPDVAKRRISDAFFDVAPTVLTCLLPLAALLLELLYRRRYYVEHLVLSMNLTAVALLLFALAAVTQWQPAALLAALGAATHVVVSLRVVYAQSWWRTIPKALVAMGGYVVLVILGLVGTVFLAIIQS